MIAARTFLRRNFPGGGRVLCAVSGGMDSMCLLHFMAAQPGFAVAAAHFNHRLRGEAADRDQRFVEAWCAERGIPCFTGSGDTRALMERRGLSLEEAARDLRYAFLEETARREGFDAVFTAHHADDNAETMLLNLIRGTGGAGLAGIPPVRGKICRPFLRLSRETLADYAVRFGVTWVEDETNEEDAAARNVLRHRVMPVLRQLNPRAVENMSFAAEVLRRERAALEEMISALAAQSVGTGDGAAIAASALLEAPLPVAEGTVLRLLTAAAGGGRDLGAAHVEAVLDLAERGREGARVSLPRGLEARLQGGVVSIRTAAAPAAEAALEPGRPTPWGDYVLTLLDRPGGPGLALEAPAAARITVGPCLAGGRLRLPGATGSRSVKRLCLDRRISLEERDRLPAIYVDGTLAAVWRLGTDAAFFPAEPGGRFIQIQNKTEENAHEK